MLRNRHCSGFTLVELLMALTLVGVLLALGAPSLATYLQNSKLSSAAANYYAALQTARAEAIRRNRRVDFVMTNSSVAVAGAQDSAVGDVNGRSWLVRALLDSAGPTFELIDAKPAGEGEGHAGTPAVAVSATGPAGFDGTITFNGFGGTTVPTAYSIEVTNPSGGACALAGGPMRCRLINVTPGGQITACDPAAPTGDSRAC